MNGHMPTFHGTDVPPAPAADALFHVIPVPFEASVSYGTGTAQGPRAIIEASAQLELFDGKRIPAVHGIHTADPVDCDGRPEEVLARIEAAVGRCLALDKCPVVLGGEHTVSAGAISALRRKHGRFGVVQFDAHADLRDSYQGSAHSHACVMRRIAETGIPVVQLGTRSYSLEEQRYRQEHAITSYDAETICRHGVESVTLPADFPDRIYLTFDVDGLDASVMPATGTPVPGGLSWYQALWLIERILAERACIGFDIVEFAPIAGQHWADFTAAQLTYAIMGSLVGSPPSRRYWQLPEPEAGV